MEKKKIIIFSHGFGVKKDDRGLFTDIAASLPGYISVMFDYNDVDEENNTFTIMPFSEQVDMLTRVVREQKSNYPDADIYLICHSQGSRVAALAKITGIQKTIMIAPPVDAGFARTITRYKNNPNAYIDLEGVSELPRSDGSRTLVPAKYWEERKNERSPILDFNELVELTDLYIIKAKQDNVTGDTLFEGLADDVTLLVLDGDHDFTNTRNLLCEEIKNILNS